MKSWMVTSALCLMVISGHALALGMDKDQAPNSSVATSMSTQSANTPPLNQREHQPLLKVTPNTCGGINSPTSGTGCDHDGYRCASPGTCVEAMGAICTHNC